MAMNRESFEAELRRQGYGEITLVDRPALAALGEHTHPFEAHALILEGDISIRCVGADEKTYRAGDTFHLATGVPHEERYGPHGVRYVVGRR